MTASVDDRDPSAESTSRRADREDDRDTTLQLVIAIGRAYRAIERGVRPQLARRGLGLSEFAVLEALYHKGSLKLGEISDRILVTGASTTYVVKKLERRGLMRRTPSAEDQRIIFGELTPEGRTLIADVFPGHVERLCDLMADLSASQKRTAARLLGRLTEARSGRRAGQGDR